MELKVDDLLRKMVELDASDLHIKVGSPPGFRVSGSIQPAEGFEALEPEKTEQLVKQVLDEEQYAEFDKTGDFDCAYSIAGLSRFRSDGRDCQ